MLLNGKQCHKNVNEWCLHFNVCFLSLLTFMMVLINDFDVGVYFSLCMPIRMTHMNAQKFY